jgi:hypothetical protein
MMPSSRLALPKCPVGVLYCAVLAAMLNQSGISCCACCCSAVVAQQSVSMYAAGTVRASAEGC